MRKYMTSYSFTIAVMARVLFLTLLMAVWVSTGAATSSLNLDSVSPLSRDPVDGATFSDEKRTSEALDCPAPFRQLGSGCYYFEDEETLTWDNARAYCQAMGQNVDLAVLDDCYQLEVVWNYILVNSGTDWRWIGGSDRSLEGSFHWVTGTPVPMGTPFWYPGRPNNTGGCVCLFHIYGYFIDYNCTSTGRFICQILY